MFHIAKWLPPKSISLTVTNCYICERNGNTGPVSAGRLFAKVDGLFCSVSVLADTSVSSTPARLGKKKSNKKLLF